MKENKLITTKVKASFLLFLLLCAMMPGNIGFASPEPAITLTFDDGWLSQYENAAPIIKSADQKATIYIPSELIGTEGYMTWNNLVSMVQDGWEVGGHTVNHLELPTLTEEEIAQQVSDNFETLAAHGLYPVSFATPYGAYDPTVIANIASYFENHRGFHDIGYNAWPYNQYLLYVQQITNQTTLAEVEGWIQEAINNNYWLIIVFHQILPTVEMEDTYSWTNADLEALMTMLESYNIKTKSIAETLNMKESILVNSDFDNGISDGWTTPTPDKVFVDGGGRGAVPTPASSIEFMGSADSAYLYGPNVEVSTSTEYGVRIFNNTVNFQSGEFGYYIDEYNENNEWISWKFLGTTSPNQVIDESYAYQPTQETVYYAGLRVYMSASSTGYVYIDNALFFEMGAGDPLPVPDPIASLIPYPPLANSNFDQGIAEGWTASQNGQVEFSTSTRGTLPSVETNIKMIGGVDNAYLFSPKVQVDSANSYDVTAYIDATEQTSGEVGLYIDEYDELENWSSGKWLGYQPAGYAGDLAFKYKPSSETVFSASVQTYLTANSTGMVYLDNIDINVALPEALPVELPFVNYDFSNGMNDGWKTNQPELVVFATSSRGVLPSIDANIQMTSATSSSHLFSPKALVSSENNYEIKVYIDAQDLIAGEVGIYIDEFDVEGNWISGKWIGYMPNETAEELEAIYKPSSETVNSASMQIYLTPFAQGDVYIDNVEMNLLAPAPLPVELPFLNSDFLLGLAEGWTTNNNEQVMFATSSRGTMPTIDANIKMIGGDSSAHLFSPKAVVASTSQYMVKAYIDTVDQNGGEVGVYIDEYDANENWISGQWLGFQAIGLAGDLNFSYIPSSELSAFASVQVYLTNGSTGAIYLDNVEMTLVQE